MHPVPKPAAAARRTARLLSATLAAQSRSPRRVTWPFPPPQLSVLTYSQCCATRDAISDCGVRGDAHADGQDWHSPSSPDLHALGSPRRSADINTLLEPSPTFRESVPAVEESAASANGPRARASSATGSIPPPSATGKPGQYNRWLSARVVGRIWLVRKDQGSGLALEADRRSCSAA
jgi:hypothetical protein